jgi:predicted ribonuclease YlaK
VGIALARANKALCITIHDSTKLEEQANTKIPDGLKDRVHFIAHDFFDAQPASSKDADLYLLRHILHDWSERECVQILRALTSTMKEGARILVAEQILAPIGNLPNHTEKIMRALDMQMMVQFGSKERTLEDFGALFELADPRLRIVDLKAPSGSADTFMELMLL